jgi:hypothetical protein
LQYFNSVRSACHDRKLREKGVTLYEKHRLGLASGGFSVFVTTGRRQAIP